jgi:hypothetical protein
MEKRFAITGLLWRGPIQGRGAIEISIGRFWWRRKRLLTPGYGCGLESSAEIIVVVEDATERKER